MTNADNPTTDSTDSTTFPAPQFEDEISGDRPTSFDEFPSDVLLQNAATLDEIIDDYERHVVPPNETSSQLELLKDLKNTLRGEAEKLELVSEADHVIEAVEPIWLTVVHIPDPETGEPMEVNVRNRDLLASMFPETAEYECSCGEELSNWSAVEMHLAENTPRTE